MSKKTIIQTEGDTSTVLVKITMRAADAARKQPASGDNTTPVEKQEQESTPPRKAAGAEQAQSSRIIRVSMD